MPGNRILSIDFCRNGRLLCSINLPEYTLLAASSLFVIVDPVAMVPAFLAMTPNDTVEQRARTAKVACCVAAGCCWRFRWPGRSSSR